MAAEEVLQCGVEYAGQPRGLAVWFGGKCDDRVRPLDRVFVADARAQVHFMRYVCEVMKKECLEKSPLNLNLVGEWRGRDAKIHDVLARSNELCLFSYEKPLYSYEMGRWLIPKCARGGEVRRRMGLVLTAEQRALFLALTYWRDIVGRMWARGCAVRCSDDESPEFVLPITLLLRIVFDADGVLDGAAWFGRMMGRQHPYVQKEKEALVELVRRVAAVKKEKMAEYAMTVEGLCREFTVRVG